VLTTIERLTIDGRDHHRVPVAIYDVIPTQVFGRDAQDHDSAQTHVGFAQIGTKTRLLAGYRQTDGSITWEARD